MNKERRKKVSAAITLIQEAREILDNVRDEEEDCYENLPANLQNSSTAEKLSENIEILEQAIDGLDQADELEEL